MAPQRPFSRPLSPSKQMQSLDVVVERSLAKAAVLSYWRQGNPWSSKTDSKLVINYGPVFWLRPGPWPESRCWHLSRLTHTIMYPRLSWGKNRIVKRVPAGTSTPVSRFLLADCIWSCRPSGMHSSSLPRLPPCTETAYQQKHDSLPSKCCLAMGLLAPVSFGFRTRCLPP